MKISVWAPQDEFQNPRNSAYLFAKRYFLELEMLGMFTLQTLQAGILLCLYEIGHGLYPSAYLTVGTCARYGIGLGLDKEALLPFRSPNIWLEAEEKKRTWWAILILDRFVTLGYATRSLATQDPQSSDLLPVDDELWEQGVCNLDF
ncbi:hypothetical protein VE00_10881 [Pseudogymnoascus sp. WSF 3629]|nr:hypothetical protein VE00_10881 [Pseudogymnoascus sp. WSF 3629]